MRVVERHGLADQARLARDDLKQAPAGVRQHGSPIAAACDDRLEVAPRDPRARQLRRGLRLLAQEDLLRVGLDETRSQVGAELEPLLEIPAAVALDVVHRPPDERDRDHPDDESEAQGDPAPPLGGPDLIERARSHLCEEIGSDRRALNAYAPTARPRTAQALVASSRWSRSWAASSTSLWRHSAARK